MIAYFRELPDPRATQVDSVYGEGATFRFFIEAQTAPLPLSPIQEKDERSLAAHIIGTNSPAAEASSSITLAPLQYVSCLTVCLMLTRISILVTEDNIINQVSRSRLLILLRLTFGYKIPDCFIVRSPVVVLSSSYWVSQTAIEEGWLYNVGRIKWTTGN